MGKASRAKAAWRNEQSQKVLNSALDAIHARPGINNIRIQSDLPQEEKISNALSVLLKQQMRGNESLHEYQLTLNIIVTAWNISILTVDEQSEAFLKIMANVSDVAIQQGICDLLKSIIAIKQTHFPHDKRLIVSSDVRFEGGRYRVVAAACVPNA
jgi:hypothetical protein